MSHDARRCLSTAIEPVADAGLTHVLDRLERLPAKGRCSVGGWFRGNDGQTLGTVQVTTRGTDNDELLALWVPSPRAMSARSTLADIGGSTLHYAGAHGWGASVDAIVLQRSWGADVQTTLYYCIAD